jgi:hypothetical protein
MPDFEKDKPGIWYTDTMRRLQVRPKRMSFAQIAEETGLEADWIRHFANGRIPQPSVNRIEVLRNYFISKKIG